MLINMALANQAAQLGEQLMRTQSTVTTAESCTGGAIAASLTAVVGSSAWFDASFVTYSNAMKTQLLAVPPALIEQHGVVSESVVIAMAQGACRVTGADWAIAVSGIAGPAGGSEQKPVGTVCLAWGGKAGWCAHTFLFAGDRDAIREQSVMAGLAGLQGYLEER